MIQSKISIQQEYSDKKNRLFNQHNIPYRESNLQTTNHSKTPQSKHQYLSRNELPDVVSYLAKNVIKTLEPLIDAFINEKMLLQQ